MKRLAEASGLCHQACSSDKVAPVSVRIRTLSTFDGLRCRKADLHRCSRLSGPVPDAHVDDGWLKPRVIARIFRSALRSADQNRHYRAGADRRPRSRTPGLSGSAPSGRTSSARPRCQGRAFDDGGHRCRGAHRDDPWLGRRRLRRQSMRGCPGSISSVWLGPSATYRCFLKRPVGFLLQHDVVNP
jgi:hypothetical protein